MRCTWPIEWRPYSQHKEGQGERKSTITALAKRFEVTSTFRQGCEADLFSKTSTNGIRSWFQVIETKKVYGCSRLKIVTNFGRAAFGRNGGRKPPFSGTTRGGFESPDYDIPPRDGASAHLVDKDPRRQQHLSARRQTALLWATGGRVMRFQKTIVCNFATLVLFTSLAAAQSSQLKRVPDVPYVPTTEEAVKVMLKLAGVKGSDIVYDLGCGDGRIVIAAAKEYGAHGVGIDINPERIKEANANAKTAGVENLVHFEQEDLFKADIHQATVVTLFLLRSVNLKLRPKLLRDLKPGTRIVSNTFDMGDWKPVKKESLGDSADDDTFSHQFFLWIVPVRKEKC
jgi:SAM-dependent methyltransferase